MEQLQRADKRAAAAHLLMRIGRLHRTACDGVVGQLEIHRSEHMTLMYLSHCEGTPSQREIAEHFSITPAAVAAGMKALERKGYIERRPCPDDSRKNEIRITERGREAISVTHTRFDEIDQAMFSPLDDGECDALLHCLEKIKESLERLIVCQSEAKGERP